MTQSSEEYAKEVYRAWLGKVKEAITSSLNSGYKDDGSDIEFYCGPLAIKHSLPVLHDYLSVADAIDTEAGPGETAYSIVHDYYYNEESEAYRSKVFIVVCCPSMSGKTQFAFTLPLPTIYIPLVQNQDIYKNFTPLFRSLKKAAFRDLAKCYKYFAGRKEATFDPIVSATNAAIIFSGESKSYVLGFFAHIATLIRDCSNAAASTRAIVDYMTNMKGILKIKPVSLEFFLDNYSQFPYFVVLDEFPPDGQSQIVALFIRNILRSQSVALIVMSTSAQITNMVSPGNTLEKGTGDSDKNLLWAIVIRLLPEVTLLPLLIKRRFKSLKGFLDFLKQLLSKILPDVTTLDAFIRKIKDQLTSSRPGICKIIIDSLLEMILPGHRYECFPEGACPDEPNYVEEIDLRTSLEARKSMMFESPGFFGSLSLVFPNFHIDSDLFGPTSTAHINHHLFYLSNPLLKNHMKQVPHAKIQPVSFNLYIRMNENDVPTEAEEIIAWEEEENDEMHQILQDLKAISSNPGEPDLSDESAGTSAVQDMKRSSSVNTHPENHPKKPYLEPETTVVNKSAASSKISLYLDKKCRAVDRFIPKSEIPSLDTELFCYLGPWYIRNSFIAKKGNGNATGDAYCCLINTIHSHVKDYVSKVTAIAPGNQHALNNDGTVAEALAVQCVIFSSHVFAEYDQNGIRFLYRVLRNCDIESKSTSITRINEIPLQNDTEPNLKNFEAIGPSGRLIFESAALATKMSQIRVPYLGPIERFGWSNLNQILPSVFGNIFRPPSKRASTGYGMDFEFEYYDEKGCKRAEVEVKDFRRSLGVSDLRKIIRRISREAKLHFLFCGPVARTLSSSKNMAAHLARDLEEELSSNSTENNVHEVSEGAPPMGGTIVPDANSELMFSHVASEKDIFIPFIGETSFIDEYDDSGDEVDVPNQTLEEQAKKNTETLLSVLRSEKVNLYYVDRSVDANEINFNVVTLYESSENNKSSIIIPFIPVTVDDISMREKSILLEREYKILAKRLPNLFYPGGLTTIGELVSLLRDLIKEKILNEENN